MCISVCVYLFINLPMHVNIYVYTYAHVCMLTMCVHVYLAVSFIEVYCVPRTGLNTL